GMAPIEGLSVCIDRWEGAIEDGRGVARPGRVPAARTSWREADAACRAAGHRLCTLAEWERACAGPEGRTYPYGDAFAPGRCNGAGAEGGTPRPAGSLRECVTPAGVFDLSGNVWEWTADAVQEGGVRELRGGGYGNGEALLRCRPAERLLQPEDEPHTAYGFRCCVDR
ncbi:MAG: SUMF1/EgtB/PvdO family nonheme iron enzyme, partial [Deltaproteobacteria bacterium]|nr:SUMF1/EgtB/PvdO family nonheme iron enzyme [Deltaproteobacteria bacterium]